MAKKGKRGAGLLVPVTIFGALAEIVGKTKESRGKIMASLWKRIKRLGLQNAKNRRMIDAAKDKLFLEFCGGKKQVSMLQLGGMVSKFVKK